MNMTFDQLKKEAKLLIFMSNREASTGGKPITLSEDADEIIAEGVTKSRRSLYTMLAKLRRDNLVANIDRGCWTLTVRGRVAASQWMNKCDAPGNEEDESTGFFCMGDLIKRVTALEKRVEKLEADKKQLVDGLTRCVLAMRS